MHGPSLILISSRDEDRRFVSAIAKNVGVGFLHKKSWEDVAKLSDVHPRSLIFWEFSDQDPTDGEKKIVSPDSLIQSPNAGINRQAALPDIDDFESIKKFKGIDQGQAFEIPPSIRAIQKTLSRLAFPSPIIALTDKTFNHYRELSMTSEFICRYVHNNFVRQSTQLNDEFFTRWIQSAYLAAPAGIGPYFPPQTQIQRLLVKKTDDRVTTLHAIQAFFAKEKYDPRVVSRISQGVDELLMNAIFDAPRDEQGTPIRHLTKRDTRFDLDGGGITIEFAITSDYAGICVTDPWGSLNREVISQLLRKNYLEQDYKASNYIPSAGLGLYGIIQSGLSLQFCCKPRTRTDSMIFFPHGKSFKSFKDGFQFVGCLTYLS